MTNTTGIILAVAAPNQCRDGRKTMCAIVLSDDLGLIRIYPLDASQKYPVWSQVDLALERSSTDNRHESYKVLNCVICGKIEESDHKRKILNQCVIKSGLVDPIEYQKESRSSIIISKLKYGTLECTLSQRIPETSHEDEEHPWLMTQANHWSKPYLGWVSDQGVTHKTHLLGREVYMGLQNNPENPWNLFNNLQLNNPDWEHWIVLGNMKDRRNVWVAPHIHRLKKNASHSTDFFSTILDGKPDGYPYSKQESFNALIAGNQLELFTTQSTEMDSYRGSTEMKNSNQYATSATN